MLREGRGNVKARSKRGHGKVKVRSRQCKQNLNRSYNFVGFDTIEITLVLETFIDLKSSEFVISFWSVNYFERGTQSKKSITTLYTPLGAYYGKDTLEGFAADAEFLGKKAGEKPEYDNAFYRLCIQDNQYIFELNEDHNIRIPEMKYEDLEKIIDEEMKKNKACDIYKLTAEHLKFAGPKARAVILNLVNDKEYYQTGLFTE